MLQATGRVTLGALIIISVAAAQREIPPGSLNKPERLEWFRDLGLGLFIHWSVDRRPAW